MRYISRKIRYGYLLNPRGKQACSPCAYPVDIMRLVIIISLIVEECSIIESFEIGTCDLNEGFVQS